MIKDKIELGHRRHVLFYKCEALVNKGAGAKQAQIVSKSLKVSNCHCQRDSKAMQNTIFKHSINAMFYVRHNMLFNYIKTYRYILFLLGLQFILIKGEKTHHTHTHT